MGYVRELGLKHGFVERNIRGEDGRMCFQLMQHGKIVQIRDRSNRVWTFPRTLDKEPNLLYSIAARAMLEISRIPQYFYKQAPHDVNTSKNYDPKAMKIFKHYKSVHKAKEPID